MKTRICPFCCLLLALCLAALGGLSAAHAEAGKSSGFIPRLSDYREVAVPDEALPMADAVPAEFTPGADLAIWEDTLAFYDYSGGYPLLRVFVQRDGEMRLKDEYREEARISNIVLWADGLAYLVGGLWDEKEDVELVTVGADGERTRTSLGPVSREQAPYVGPLLRLSDGRLLLADGQGLLQLCAADGSDMRLVSDIPVQDFVYCNQFVYFSNPRDQVTYRDVYCKEYDEYLDVAYPRLYRMRLDGTLVERITDCGVRGLAARGPYILYQNIDDPFVWPQGELPEEWLYGVVHCYHGVTGQRYTLGVDSARYLATPLGLAAWLPDLPGGEFVWNEEEQSREGACPEFSLVMHDWSGKPLYRLDAGSLYWYDLPCLVTDDGIWVYEHDFINNIFEFDSIPLDGSAGSF